MTNPPDPAREIAERMVRAWWNPGRDDTLEVNGQRINVPHGAGAFAVEVLRPAIVAACHEYATTLRADVERLTTEAEQGHTNARLMLDKVKTVRAEIATCIADADRLIAMGALPEGLGPELVLEGIARKNTAVRIRCALNAAQAERKEGSD